jgi:curved DNA-binding protein CbpA
MLKKAFRKKAFTAHPDHGAETGDFLRLEWDFEIIRRHFGWEN